MKNSGRRTDVPKVDAVLAKTTRIAPEFLDRTQRIVISYSEKRPINCAAFKSVHGQV